MFSNPEKVVDQLGLLPTMHVADLGAGIGTYSLKIAKAVLAGKVYAVDVQKDLLVKLKNSANQAKLTNVEIIAGDIEHLSGTHLKESSVDMAVAANVVFQLSNKKSFVQEVKRILKKGGRVLLVDWSDSFGGIGPQPEHVFTEHKAKELFQAEGFAFERKISAGDHHYGLIFKKS